MKPWLSPALPLGSDLSTSIIEELDETSSASSRMDKHCDGVGNSDEHNRFTLFSIPIGDPKLRSQYRRLQASIYNFLERPCGAISVSYHFAVFGLVVAGLVFAVLETMPGLKDDQDLTFGIYVLEAFLLTLFTLEYVLRMWSAGCRSTYVGFLGRVRFAFKPFVVVDLIVIGSTCAVIIPSQKPNLSSAISILRFFQVLRMVRFDRQGGSWKLLGSVLYLHRQELLTTIYIGFCSLIFATFFVYQAEKTVNKAEFETFADSFWWGVVTLTTVGYGDKVPKSWAGRGIAAFFAIMGISFFALPAGILGSGFALKVSQQQRQKQAKRRRRPAATLIQCNWRYYASRKDSKLNATWSPYIKFLQEKNVRKEEAQNNSEKPVQFSGRSRKISIFGRKASGLSSDGISKPESSASSATTPEHFRLRSKRSIGNDLFPSSDSLQDTDDEHGRNSVVQNVIIVKDSTGNVCLPPAYKQSIRFTRYLKFLVALKKFKLAKKPYDVKDVIEQYSTGHVELLGKVRGIGSKIDGALGYKVGTEKIDENPTRTNVVHRLSKLEKQVKSLDFKLDRVISLLEKSGKNDFPVIKTSSEAGKVSSCSVCGQNNNATAENNSNEKLPLMQVNENHITPTRRRKFALANKIPKVNEGSNGLSEEDEAVTREDYAGSTVPCLLTEDLMGVKRNSLNEFDSAVKTQPDVQPFDGNYLSPKPFGCESYDLRSRSDSAFSEKPDDGNSTGVSPASSDSECLSSNSTVVALPSDTNNDTSTLGGNHLQETTM